ncbi:MAG: hypothetical protein QXT32_00330 [Candidatus Nitrosocaldaceae archaeon]
MNNMEERSKERIEYALKEIEKSINSINLLRNRLLESFNEKFPEYSNEPIDDLSSIQVLLLALHNKIDSIARFYELVTIMENTSKTLDCVIDEMNDLLPSIDLALNNIMNSLIEVKAILGIKNEKMYPELPYTNDY